ncbi:MAG: hypothetical protein H5U02_07545 [Clostridia bacterium]|nr:hypothetical protein [Clostridia bacterium]
MNGLRIECWTERLSHLSDSEGGGGPDPALKLGLEVWDLTDLDSRYLAGLR